MSNLTPEEQAIIDSAIEFSESELLEGVLIKNLDEAIRDYKQKQESDRVDKLRRPFEVKNDCIFIRDNELWDDCSPNKEELCANLNAAYAQACEDFNVFEEK